MTDNGTTAGAKVWAVCGKCGASPLDIRLVDGSGRTLATIIARNMLTDCVRSQRALQRIAALAADARSGTLETMDAALEAIYVAAARWI